MRVAYRTLEQLAAESAPLWSRSHHSGTTRASVQVFVTATHNSRHRPPPLCRVVRTRSRYAFRQKEEVERRPVHCGRKAMLHARIALEDGVCEVILQSMQNDMGFTILTQIVRDAIPFLTQHLSEQREERTHLPREHLRYPLNMVLECLNTRITRFQAVILHQSDSVFCATPVCKMGSATRN